MQITCANAARVSALMEIRHHFSSETLEILALRRLFPASPEYGHPRLGDDTYAEEADEVYGLVGSDFGACQLRKAAGEAHARQLAAGKVHSAQARTDLYLYIFIKSFNNPVLFPKQN